MPSLNSSVPRRVSTLSGVMRDGGTSADVCDQAKPVNESMEQVDATANDLSVAISFPSGGVMLLLWCANDR